ncbi:hypothetical protein JCM10295v2_005653 [Rhodotorula toruloides]
MRVPRPADLAGTIWTTQMHSHVTFLWARNVEVIGAGALDVLALCLAGDLFFTQEARLWHAIGFVPPILATNIGAPPIHSLKPASARPPVIATVGKGYPTKQQRYSIFPPRNKNYSLVRNMLAIVTLATFGPVALFALWWAAIGGAATSSCFVAAQIWAAPPYLFGPAAIGCTNIPPTISIFLGLLVAGPIANWDVAQQAKRNGGVREPEMRLRVAIAGGVVAAVGNII